MKIKSRTTVRVAPDVFDDCAKGYLKQLPNEKLSVGDQLLIKEFIDTGFTGSEIVAEVTEVDGKEFTFRTYAIVRKGNGR